MMDPRALCKKHLWSGHRATHQWAKLPNLRPIDIHMVYERHKEVVRELKRRGCNHRTPIGLTRQSNAGPVRSDSKLPELLKCAECRGRYDRLLLETRAPQ